MAERCVRDAEVRSSNLRTPTIIHCTHSLIGSYARSDASLPRAARASTDRWYD
jgi:hypothetical protein